MIAGAHTRAEMVQILREGKSVLHGDGVHRRIISREEDLPSEAELASGDREELLKARDAYVARRDKLQAAIDAIDHELAALGTPKKTGKARTAAQTATGEGEGDAASTPPAENPLNSDASAPGRPSTDQAPSVSPTMPGR